MNGKANPHGKVGVLFWFMLHPPAAPTVGVILLKSIFPSSSTAGILSLIAFAQGVELTANLELKNLIKLSFIMLINPAL